MINGILNIYKEKGYTSHDVVACLRKITAQRKIGHTGTLDPDAEGVLPVCLGRATKVCGMLTDTDKTYEAVLLLGKTTDTQDISGNIINEKDTEDISGDKAKECIKSFIGEYNQIPPMYSALKVGGKKLYELAREGKTVERKSRKVHIYGIQIKEISIPRVCMEIDCSKGTYVRTLCNDIGEKIGTGGCMESLLRTKVGRFQIKESVRLNEVEEAVKAGELSRLLLPLDAVFTELEKAVVKEDAAFLAYNGNPLLEEQVFINGDKMNGQKFRIYDKEGRFIGIYIYKAANEQFRLEKMFLDQESLK